MSILRRLSLLSLVMILFALPAHAQQDDEGAEDSEGALAIADWKARISPDKVYEPRLLNDTEAASQSLPTAIKLPDPCTVGTFDSGWFYDSNEVDHITTLRHDFGYLPKFINLWFSPTASDGEVYLKSWSWLASHSGNPVSITIDIETINLHIWNGAPLHGSWDPRREEPWAKYNTGFWRVLACR